MRVHTHTHTHTSQTNTMIYLQAIKIRTNTFQDLTHLERNMGKSPYVSLKEKRIGRLKKKKVHWTGLSFKGTFKVNHEQISGILAREFRERQLCKKACMLSKTITCSGHNY